MNHHFSHPQHELLLWNPLTHELPQGLMPLCSCCQLPPTEPMYVCIPCDFFLHLSCAQYPQLIIHPAHKNHNLILLPTSPYPGGAFNCDACNRSSNGFCYHCSSCEYDLHVSCASKPFTITHQYHPCPLELTFISPYDNAKGFSCDICHKVGIKEWLYRCSACEFDVHLDCTMGTPAPAPVLGGQSQFLHGETSGSNTTFQNPIMGSPAQTHPLLQQQQHHHHQLTQSTTVGANPRSPRQFLPGNAAGPSQVMTRPDLFHGSASIGRLGIHAGPSSLMDPMTQGLLEGRAQGGRQGRFQRLIRRGNTGGASTSGHGGGMGNVFGGASSSGGQN